MPNQTDGDHFGLLVKVLLRKMLDGKLLERMEAPLRNSPITSRMRGTLGDALVRVQPCRKTCSEDEVAVDSRCSPWATC